jgi:hypothetical protein
LPSTDSRLLGSFGGTIGLTRIDGLPSASVRPGQTVSLTLVWQSLAPAAADYTAFVHADDNVNHLRVQQDHFPCDGSFPTTRWTSGEQVFDRFTLAIPAAAPPGTYDVTAGLYSLPGPKNLDLDDGGAELKLGTFEVRA